MCCEPAFLGRPPEISDTDPQHLCADAGYTGKRAKEALTDREYTPHVRSRGEEKSEKQEGKQARRWVAEPCFHG